MTTIEQTLPTRVARARGRLAARTAYGVAGLSLAAVAWSLDGWSWPLLVFALLPDLPLVVGFGRGLGKGQLHPRVVPAYNATHRLVGPVALVAVGLWLTADTTHDTGAVTFLVAGLAWAAHVCIDRACGYGLRRRDGWQR
jgi:hypothetical protein